MKKLMLKIFIAMLAMSPILAQSALDNNTAQSVTPNNLLVNPGFENGAYGWTASGGATKTANTTAKGLGSYGYEWDSNSASQTLLQSVTIPDGLKGRMGYAYCDIKAASGTPTHTITVDDGSTNLVTAQTISTSTSAFTRNYVNFLFPSSGSVRIKFTSVNSNEPSIYLDSCYLGEASNLTQVNQVQFVGSAYIATTSSCTWSRTNTALGAFSTTSACPGPTVETNPGPGTIQTTDTDLPKFTVNSLPPGVYRVIVSGMAGISGGSNHNSYTINDGTNSSGRGFGNQGSNGYYAGMVVEGWFTYTSPGDRTFELYGSAVGNAASIDNAAGNNRLQFSIVRFPSTSEIAVRNTIAYFPTYTAKVSSGGTVSDESSDWINGNCSVANTSEFTCTWNSNIFATAPNCTVTGLDTSTAAPIAKIFTQAGTTSVVIKTYNNSASATAYAFNLICQSTTAVSSPVPIMVGSVTSSSTGQERIERAVITNNGTAAIGSQSGSWVSSVSRSASGVVDLTLTSGMFTAIPTCTCSAKGLSGNLRACEQWTTGTTQSSTLVSFATWTTSTNAAFDIDFNVICMGPR